jgi:hypothetical protein
MTDAQKRATEKFNHRVETLKQIDAKRTTLFELNNQRAELFKINFDLDDLSTANLQQKLGNFSLGIPQNSALNTQIATCIREIRDLIVILKAL